MTDLGQGTITKNKKYLLHLRGQWTNKTPPGRLKIDNSVFFIRMQMTCITLQAFSSTKEVIYFVCDLKYGSLKLTDTTTSCSVLSNGIKMRKKGPALSWQERNDTHVYEFIQKTLLQCKPIHFWTQTN